MWSTGIEVPYPVQSIWMFANWYAELNFFCFATFPTKQTNKQTIRRWVPSHSAGPWRWRQTVLKKERVSLRGVYVWDVNSKVTKYSDYFVWKDTSERMTRRWDDTSWQKASEFLCIKTPPFSRSSATKKCAKIPRKCSLRRATNITLSKFRGWRRKKKKSAKRGFLKPHFARF